MLASAVIPLYLIGKNRGLSGLQRTLLCALLLLLPAYAGGTGYDLHENCFLTPLILWLFYGIEKKNNGVIRDYDDPYTKTGGLAVLFGSLAPNGAAVKRSAVAKEMLVHKGPARVFDSEEEAIEEVANEEE